MPTYTWSFDTNAKDQNNQHPFVRMDTGVEATVANGKLTVSTTGYVCNISDIDMSRKWKIVFSAQDLATANTNPTYFLTIGPVFSSSSVGGMVVWRPHGEDIARLDDSPMVTDLRRICQNTNAIYNRGWSPPFEIVYDPMSDVRETSLYQEGVRISQSPLNPKLRDPDTTGRFLYIGQIVDSAATPCSFDSITLDNDWNGTTMSWAPIAGNHKYHRVRLLGSCTLTECALDTNRSATTDDGVTIRLTSTLTLKEGTSSDSIYRLYDKLYVETFALTANTTTGWNTIQYDDTAGFDPLQLRIGVKAANTPPTWCELQYSLDGVTWYLEDRFRIPTTHFETTGVRADLVATYQRTIATGRWDYVRSYTSAAGGGSFANAKSLSLNGTSQWGTAIMKNPTTTSWMMNKNYTVSAWIKLNNNTDSHTIYHPFDTSITARYDHLFRVNNSKLQFYSETPTSFGRDATTPLVANVWYHAVVTRDSNNSIRFYLNGNPDNTATATTADSTPYTGATIELDIGRGWGRSTGEHFNGLMDDVSVWNTTLTPAQVTEIWNGGKPGNLATHSMNTNLQAWWRFEASDGTDSSGKGRTLTMSPGNPGFSTDVKTV